jgi:NAD(P)-dependent dehydrogenase (short-subunit alcohol dehydrogenase family)
MQIEGTGAVVVGGASGMARSTAEELAARGAQIAIVDLPTSAGVEVAKALGPDALFVAADVRDEKALTKALDTATSEFGGIHIGVNTAGGGYAKRTVTREGPHELDAFRSVIELNLIGSFNFLRLAAERMSRNEPNADGERGVVINTASIAAFEGQIGQVAYSAAKSGIAGMTLTAARDLGSLGIRVMTIAPSLFQTGLTKLPNPEMAQQLTEGAAFPRRMGRPEEFAHLAVSIVENPMLNGSTIRLDAGQRFGPR